MQFGVVLLNVRVSGDLRFDKDSPRLWLAVGSCEPGRRGGTQAPESRAPGHNSGVTTDDSVKQFLSFPFPHYLV